MYDTFKLAQAAEHLLEVLDRVIIEVGEEELEQAKKLLDDQLLAYAYGH